MIDSSYCKSPSLSSLIIIISNRCHCDCHYSQHDHSHLTPLLVPETLPDWLFHNEETCLKKGIIIASISSLFFSTIKPCLLILYPPHFIICLCWLYRHWISPVPSPALPSAHLGLVGARASFRFGFPGKALYGVLLQVLIGAQWTNFMGFWMGCWWFSWDVYWICMGVF
jgi:hypothetical protein